MKASHFMSQTSTSKFILKLDVHGFHQREDFRAKSHQLFHHRATNSFKGSLHPNYEHNELVFLKVWFWFAISELSASKKVNQIRHKRGNSNISLLQFGFFRSKRNDLQGWFPQRQWCLSCGLKTQIYNKNSVYLLQYCLVWFVWEGTIW